MKQKRSADVDVDPAQGKRPAVGVVIGQVQTPAETFFRVDRADRGDLVLIVKTGHGRPELVVSCFDILGVGQRLEIDVTGRGYGKIQALGLPESLLRFFQGR